MTSFHENIENWRRLLLLLLLICSYFLRFSGSRVDLDSGLGNILKMHLGVPKCWYLLKVLNRRRLSSFPAASLRKGIKLSQWRHHHPLSWKIFLLRFSQRCNKNESCAYFRKSARPIPDFMRPIPSQTRAIKSSANRIFCIFRAQFLRKIMNGNCRPGFRSIKEISRPSIESYSWVLFGPVHESAILVSVFKPGLPNVWN